MVNPVSSLLQAHPCPLCNHSTQFFSSDKRRSYFQCNHCHLVSVPTQFHLNALEEKAEYDLHDNRLEDPRYRKFLSRLCSPLLNFINSDKEGSPLSGLDFGCGGGPALKEIFVEAGYKMDLYDPFYKNNLDVFNRQYDFITATEVFEHLYKPQYEIERLGSILKSGGYLGIMTKQVINAKRFYSWHYKNDKTHVIFFCEKTFCYLAQCLGAEIIYQSEDVVILKKQ